MSAPIRLPVGARLVLATHNPGKAAEFRGFLEPAGVVVVTAAELGLAEPEETEPSLAGNARLKARAAAAAAGCVALADDSGLEVAALGGEPGVYSARWAGPEKDFAAAMRRIRQRLDAAPQPWQARFVCVLALALPDGACETHTGSVTGSLVWPPRGERGFGYDPIFRPEGRARTFGEMSPAEKDRISHRGEAMRRLRQAALAR